MSNLNTWIFEMLEKHGHCISMQESDCPGFLRRLLFLPTVMRDDGAIFPTDAIRDAVGKTLHFLDPEELNICTRTRPALHYVQTPAGFFGLTFQDFFVYTFPHQTAVPGLYFDLHFYDDVTDCFPNICKIFGGLKYYDGETMYERWLGAEDDDDEGRVKDFMGIRFTPSPWIDEEYLLKKCFLLCKQ